LAHEVFLVHTDTGIYIEAYANEEKAKQSAAILDEHNQKNGHPNRITYSHKSEVTL
jgi:hypothetical protein